MNHCHEDFIFRISFCNFDILKYDFDVSTVYLAEPHWSPVYCLEWQSQGLHLEKSYLINWNSITNGHISVSGPEECSLLFCLCYCYFHRLYSSELVSFMLPLFKQLHDICSLNVFNTFGITLKIMSTYFFFPRYQLSGISPLLISFLKVLPCHSLNKAIMASSSLISEILQRSWTITLPLISASQNNMISFCF